MSNCTSLPPEGFVRLSQIIGTADQPGPLPISRGMWYQLISRGAVPQPVRIGQRLTGYRVAEVRRLLEELEHGKSFADLVNRWPSPPSPDGEASGQD